MDGTKNVIRTNFDLLNRLPALSFLSADELRELGRALHSRNFSKGEVILPEEVLTEGVHFLLAGVAKITCLNRSDSRVTVALLAPGPILEFLSSPVSPWHFRCEAHSDCRVGHLSWDQFDAVTRAVSQSALRKFHENNLMQWYRWSLTFLGLDLHKRLAFVLRQLCSIFGVEESRGTLLRIPISQKDLAELVGATRPRVTEQLGKLERERVVIRQGRQLIVRLDRIENFSDGPRPEGNRSFAKVSSPVQFQKQALRYDSRSTKAAASANN